MNNNEFEELRLTDVLHALLKHCILIIVLTVLGLAVGIALSVASYMRGEMSREYAVTSSIAVTSQKQNGLFASESSSPNSTDIYLAENMVDSVIYVLKSDQTLDAAMRKINLIGISTKDIADNLSLAQYRDTQIIEMTLYWRNAEEGVQILSAINSVAPDVLIEVLKIGGVSVVNQPKSRYRIGGNMNVSLWVYMALIGLATGIGFSVLELLFQPTLIEPNDMTARFNLEVIGQVPKNRKYFGKKGSILAVDDDKSGLNVWENFASMAHILQNILGTGEHQCLYITSTAPNEGKTTAVAHLAVKLADLEKKVLLIDMDICNPGLGSLFLKKVDYEHSLNALFRGEATKEEAVTNLTAYLDLLPAILEPMGLPLDEAMLNLVSNVAKNYDYVLIDTAPVGRVADTLNLNRISKAALFVVQYDSTSMNEIQSALERMHKSGVRVVGTIVNGVTKMRDNPYYGNYGYHKRRYVCNMGKKQEEIAFGPRFVGETEGKKSAPVFQEEERDAVVESIIESLGVENISAKIEELQKRDDLDFLDDNF